jgi:DNA gyrase/topoisomerase IV subunit A
MKLDDIIQKQYKDFCLYVIESRALPRLSDGLKPVERRSLYAGKKVAKEWCKVSKLAGATMSNHPHGNVSIENCISSMAQEFASANNVPFFEGDGTFGTRLSGPGQGCASARYIQVRLSENFYKYFDVDPDLVEMVPNYDETEKEPHTFLPIVPSVLLNPTSGIAVGFACNILPRNIDEVKKAQIEFLNGKKIKSLKPYFKGFKGQVVKNADGEWATKGIWQKTGKKLMITELPIGFTRENYINVLDKLEEREKPLITNYIDNCRDDFNFEITLAEDMTDDEISDKFKLVVNLNENITLIGFNNKVLEKLTDVQVIEQFTEWRFKFYLERFKRKFEINEDELEFKKSLLKVIEKGLFKKFPNQKKAEIIKILQDEKIKNPHIVKVMQVPIYRFGKDEVEKLEEQIKELEKNKKELEVLIKSEDKRREVYIEELKK